MRREPGCLSASRAVHRRSPGCFQTSPNALHLAISGLVDWPSSVYFFSAKVGAVIGVMRRAFLRPFRAFLLWVFTQGCASLHPGLRSCAASRLNGSEFEGPNSHFSPGGEAKCMRGLSVRGARRLTSAGVLSQSVEHGEQAQRSHGGPLMCLARQPMRNAG